MIKKKIEELKQLEKKLLDDYIIKESVPEVNTNNLNFFIKLSKGKQNALIEFEKNLVEEFIGYFEENDLVNAKTNILKILNKKEYEINREITCISNEISIPSFSLESKNYVELKKLELVIYNNELTELKNVCNSLIGDLTKDAIKTIYLEYVIGLPKNIEYYIELQKKIEAGTVDQYSDEIINCRENIIAEYKVKKFMELSDCYKKSNQ